MRELREGRQGESMMSNLCSYLTSYKFKYYNVKALMPVFIYASMLVFFQLSIHRWRTEPLFACSFSETFWSVGLGVEYKMN